MDEVLPTFLFFFAVGHCFVRLACEVLILTRCWDIGLNIIQVFSFDFSVVLALLSPRGG